MPRRNIAASHNNSQVKKGDTIRKDSVNNYGGSKLEKTLNTKDIQGVNKIHIEKRLKNSETCPE